ncbi:MAG: hypothetical protein LBB61_08820 [Treponema sp.]|jgi:hypothetical protein|nr:hypothetical protein [Treponema sp.]
MKKYSSFFFFLAFFDVTVTMFSIGCASRTTVNNLGVYDLSYPNSQQCLLIIPSQITVDTIDGDTVQWNWNKLETRVSIPSGSHILSIKRDKKVIDIIFNFLPNISYTFSVKKGVVTIIEANSAK